MPALPFDREAEPLTVLAAGAVKTVMEELADALEAQAGRRLAVAFDTVGALRDRVLRGEQADLTILSRQALDAVAERGLLLGDAVELGRTGIGLAGRAADAPASIETVEGFRAALMAADSIGYADPARGATAGRHFIGVLDRMGLSDALREKLVRFPFGVDAVDALSRGEVRLAVSQATEIAAQPNVRLVGLFPPPFDLWTDYGAAALSERPGVRELLQALRGAEVAASLKRVGFA